MTAIGIAAILVMLGLIALGVPIGFALAFVGGAGNMLLQGVPQTLMQMQYAMNNPPQEDPRGSNGNAGSDEAA